jgi:hypothetical protein
MNGFDRFFSEGMKDAARRLPPLAEPRAGDEQAAVAVLESSAVITILDRAITRAARAFDTSIAVSTARRIWHSVAPADRALIAAIALIVAPFVHVGLVMWQERPAGWMWLLLPGLSLGIGLVIASAYAADQPPLKLRRSAGALAKAEGRNGGPGAKREETG